MDGGVGLSHKWAGGRRGGWRVQLQMYIVTNGNKLFGNAIGVMSQSREGDHRARECWGAYRYIVCHRGQLAHCKMAGRSVSLGAHALI